MKELPKYLREKTPKEKSRKQEEKLAQKGFLTPASGATPFLKGDVSFEDYLVEAKRTDKKSMTIQEEWLQKIFEEAVSTGKIAGIELTFKTYKLQGIVMREENIIK
jgi:hypothetical protein